MLLLGETPSTKIFQEYGPWCETNEHGNGPVLVVCVLARTNAPVHALAIII